MKWLKRSIRTKLAVFLLISIAVPMLASIIITNLRTSNIVTEGAVRQNAKLLIQGKINMANYLDQFNQISLLPYNDTKNTDTLYRILEQGKTDYLSEEEVYRSLQSMGRSIKEIYQVYLHSNSAERGYLFTRGLYKKDDQLTPGNGAALPEGTAYRVEPAHESGSYGIDKPPRYSPVQVISFHRSILQIPGDRIIGTLAIDVTPDIIDAICNELYDREQEQLYLLSGDGTVVYGPQPDQRGKRLTDPWARHVLQLAAANGQGYYQSVSGSSFQGVYVYDRLTDNDMNWTMVKVIPEQVLQAGTQQVTEVNSIVLGISLLLIIAAALIVSFWITKPVKVLTGYVNRIQSGELDTDIRLQREDEIGQLARRFRIMMETINNLVLREYKMELANKTNQLKALQAQVHPHFLYNALQSIGTAALQHGVADVYKLIMLLGKMMRYSMNTAEEFVAISQEISHTSAYLELQKQRFGSKLTYQIEVQPATEQILVPKMIVQPIVENVFKHAFDPIGGELAVDIETELQDGFVRIRIIDNGPGMSPDKREQIEARLSRQSDAFLTAAISDHIGLANVYARMLLYFGDRAGITLEPGEAGGLTVTLHIPHVTGGERL
ncbi:cache domain-containing sensor histidine kinase [Paenibacillus beijingensis]|uniref:cache domain-containing sensor histidine kinase n=1 Tax=Paenibacillus beijingensis TaxID=1126833 RepID=UPI001EE6A755|nr:sensor histidine kinase [Paenibacillus beijingensis]